MRFSIERLLGTKVMQAAVAELVQADALKGAVERGAIIDRIEELDGEIAAKLPACAEARATFDRAWAAMEAARQTLRMRERAVGEARGMQSALRNRLLKEFGEQAVVDAVNRLTAHRAGVAAELSGWRFVQSLGMNDLRRRRYASKDIPALINDAEDRLAVTDDALERALNLSHARVSPDELRDQAQALVEMATGPQPGHEPDVTTLNFA